MKIGIVLGTRPEIIKLSPIIRKLEEFKNNDYFIIHTNQHYSKSLDSIFFKELNLPKPRYNLGVGSASHGKQTGKMLEGIERVLIKERPDIVVVQGDTNSTLAGALASSKLGIEVAHVEAGLRSYDRSMPEEINRVLTDHISNYLFAPTEVARENLRREGIEENIFLVGNTIVDATLENIEIAEERKEEIFEEDMLEVVKGGDYFLVTIHRAENTDNRERLKGIVEGILKVGEYYDKTVLFPLHPRTEKKLKEYNLWDTLKNKNIEILEPAGYFKFLILERYAKLILTDSGGVQEEACILKVPCVTLRRSTERPETLEVGGNILVDIEKGDILEAVDIMLKRDRNWRNPFGDGRSGERIARILLEGRNSPLEDKI
ncbi:MAG TPA: UDP-N-acetylglucosamine 2-epimerase (non-hydrolyzing) [Methanothermococcus okinawensis]|uniref:UDP-N-acetylglucosamine 2-epimerase (Non-hydrolyzing) n=1 Tax=Methanothermococcus okinawensis TaxID=155863 RepID=A0A833E0E3_9EURY|nr:UDP-N-acetylglucosamine 2-epimerase (non-hydrolyzing) [Methanothermococcus okinawensis]HIP90877.1 UDP-N-acetylglucosamine 2-epimerase (non-hydrolyzing) [Methanothermococcus okinawensis]